MYNALEICDTIEEEISSLKNKKEFFGKDYPGEIIKIDYAIEVLEELQKQFDSAVY